MSKLSTPKTVLINMLIAANLMGGVAQAVNHDVTVETTDNYTVSDMVEVLKEDIMLANGIRILINKAQLEGDIAHFYEDGIDIVQKTLSLIPSERLAENTMEVSYDKNLTKEYGPHVDDIKQHSDHIIMSLYDSWDGLDVFKTISDQNYLNEMTVYHESFHALQIMDKQSVRSNLMNEFGATNKVELLEGIKARVNEEFGEHATPYKVELAAGVAYNAFIQHEESLADGYAALMMYSELIEKGASKAEIQSFNDNLSKQSIERSSGNLTHNTTGLLGELQYEFQELQEGRSSVFSGIDMSDKAGLLEALNQLSDSNAAYMMDTTEFMLKRIHSERKSLTDSNDVVLHSSGKEDNIDGVMLGMSLANQALDSAISKARENYNYENIKEGKAVVNANDYILSVDIGELSASIIKRSTEPENDDDLSLAPLSP